jgi:DNA-binding response OmpR family regulator
VLLIAEDPLIGCDLALTLEEIGYAVILTSINAALSPAFSSSADLVVVDVAAADRPDPVDAARRIGLKLDRPVVYLVDDDAQASRVGEQAEGAPLVMWPFSPGALDMTLRGALVATGAIAASPNRG